jgi:hypothetical protein
MLKRWLDLPRVAICSLTIASAVALGLNAYAGTLRNAGLGGGTSNTVTPQRFGPQAGTETTPVVPATTTPTPPPITFISLMGDGLSTYGGGIGASPNPQSDCTNAGFPIKSGDTGNCVEASGTITDGSGPFTSGPYSLILDIDESSFFFNGSDDCFAASGEVLLPKGVDGVQGVLRLLTAGIACNSDSGTSSTYDGTFSVDGSTGIFAGAQGTGVLSFSIDNLTTTDDINWQSFLYASGGGSGIN